MTPSFGFVLSILFLAPGFAAFAGYYLGVLRGPVRQAPAPPNSFLALAAITFGALFAHSIAATLMAANAQFCVNFACVTVPWQPNLYTQMLEFRSVDYRAGDGSAALILLSLCAVTALGFVLGWTAAAAARQSRKLRTLTYGWTAELIFSDALVVSAFVVSDLNCDGTYLGYEGIVQDVKIGSDGEIKTISLSDCDRFLLTISANKLDRQSVDRSSIPFVLLEAENVKNIALNPYFYVDALLGETSLSPEEQMAVLDAESTFSEDE